MTRIRCCLAYGKGRKTLYKAPTFTAAHGGALAGGVLVYVWCVAALEVQSGMIAAAVS